MDMEQGNWRGKCEPGDNELTGTHALVKEVFL